jgi:ferrous iron transport protein B|nr:ferrous iron transport protein B [Desulfofarcimen acetoxidans]
MEDLPPCSKKIVLAGNPNAGKSVVFNFLTGMYVDVSNYPGTTLDISSGRLGGDVVIDTPGVYGISSFNDEERIARDIILTADIVINVVNAVYLERDLFLTQQIIDTGVPVIVALNMIDEVEKQGLRIDVQKLEEIMGVIVIPTVAVLKKGLVELKNAIPSAHSGNITPNLPCKLKEISMATGSQAEALLIIEGDQAVACRNCLQTESFREEVYLLRRKHVNEIINQTVFETGKGSTFSTTLGRMMIKPLTGIPILAVILWVLYEVIGIVIAGNVVGFTEGTVMQGIYEPAVRMAVGYVVPLDSWLGIILTGEFGVLTMTFSYVLGLLLPLVAGFYLFLSLFEDSGYLPRIATLVDRLLVGIGLNGRAIIPMILGFGCVTMASITTRLLSTEREKRIAIFLLGLVIPCSAQLAVIAAIIGSIGISYAALYGLVIFCVLVIVGTLLNILLPGNPTDLLIDLPPLRLPRIGNVLHKTFTKSYAFTKEAVPLFAVGALIISVFQLTGILLFLQKMMAPLTVGCLNLPRETATAFIMGIVRRDFGVAGLNGMHLSPVDGLVSIITITLFVPCIASILVIFKERGKKEATIMWGGTWVIAFTVGGIVAQVFSAAKNISHGKIMVALVFIGMSIITIIFSTVFHRLKAVKCLRRVES